MKKNKAAKLFSFNCKADFLSLEMHTLINLQFHIKITLLNTQKHFCKFGKIHNIGAVN